MRIDWDVAIEMDDGVVLRADVFRPDDDARHPVILSYGPYAKGLAFQEGYPNQWERMVSRHPQVEAGSSNRFQNWEVVDPEKWVPDGYACVRVDSRGAGRSEGRLDPFSPRETDDLAACIEWAAEQPWSSGKVGLNGISYYAMNQWHVASRSPRGLAAMCDWERLDVPLLAAGNWGGHGLHLRGNVEGYVRGASAQKWLELHGLEHWTHFYTDYGVRLQKRFFGHFLKGEDTGWDGQRPVLLQVRHADGTFTERAEQEWPPARTEWTRWELGTGSYEALGDGVTFMGEPLERETEITGPSAAKLFVSSSTEDADLFVVLRAFDPDGEEVVFQGAIDPHTPIAQGWLRASHRKLDQSLSEPYRPYHTHDEKQPLTPGEVYELDVEIWPTSIVLPAGYRLAVTVRGTDYEHPKAGGDPLTTFRNELPGSGPFLHDDPDDRPADVFGGTGTIHPGSYVLLPVIPN